MAIKWKIEHLDPSKLFEVNYSQNPDVGGRFSLPIPNWLGSDQNPVDLVSSLMSQDGKPKDRNTIYRDCDGSWRFSFINYRDDGCLQGVKIDGTGNIMFGAPTLRQTEQLFSLIADIAPDIEHMTPDQLMAILDRSYDEIEIIDRYNDSAKNIQRDMHLYDDGGRAFPRLGLYLYNPDIVSSCIYVTGAGVFLDGPTETPQEFDNGGFIFFKNRRLQEAKAIIDAASADDSYDAKGKAKYVEKGVFFTSRRMAPHSTPIQLHQLKAQDKPFQKIVKPQRITGYPEYLPADRAVEKSWIETTGKTFELYGFTNIETPSVERIEALNGEGKITKEIYGLRRLKEDETEDADNADHDSKLALHFDLTVPFARYVAQHFNNLNFPFKRYQIQKVWRGEKAQTGRYREFTQADIDIVNPDNLSLEFDAEMPVTMWHVIDQLPIDPVTIGINNRKILNGLYKGMGIDPATTVDVIRIMDDFEKIGEDGIRRKLAALSTQYKIEGQKNTVFEDDHIKLFMAISGIRANVDTLRSSIENLGIKNPELMAGVEELEFVLDRCRELPEGSTEANLSIARGFDYYTGTVYEGKFRDRPEFGAILAGGRYDDLAGRFTKKRLPGVGISLGLSRIFGQLHDKGLIPQGNVSPTDLLITVPNQDQVKPARAIADALRDRGISVEVYHQNTQSIKRQMEYAAGKAIPFVLFFSDNGGIEIRDMRERHQTRVDISTWHPQKLRRTS